MLTEMGPPGDLKKMPLLSLTLFPSYANRNTAQNCVSN